jgi:hypothetical protein
MARTINQSREDRKQMRMNAPLAYRRIYFPKGSNMKGRGAYWVARTTKDSLLSESPGNNKI